MPKIFATLFFVTVGMGPFLTASATSRTDDAGAPTPKSKWACVCTFEYNDGEQDSIEIGPSGNGEYDQEDVDACEDQVGETHPAADEPFVDCEILEV